LRIGLAQKPQKQVFGSVWMSARCYGTRFALSVLTILAIAIYTKVKSFIARPMQMKTASVRSFGVDQKYSKFPDWIIAYVWYLNDPSKTVTYALTYQEAVEVADKMGWTKTISWEKGAYSTTNPGKKLLELLEQYKMLPPKKWWGKIINMP
jgi:hypothetical protein